MNKKELLNRLVDLLSDDEPVQTPTPEPQPQPNKPNPLQGVPASFKYNFEKQSPAASEVSQTPTPIPKQELKTGFTPVDEQVTQPSEPQIEIPNLEPDLYEAFAYCIQVKNQKLFTTENVLLMQTLRVVQRLEHTLNQLEEKARAKAKVPNQLTWTVDTPIEPAEPVEIEDDQTKRRGEDDEIVEEEAIKTTKPTNVSRSRRTTKKTKRKSKGRGRDKDNNTNKRKSKDA